MVITRETTVEEAVHSSPAAAEIFISHGIDPREKCSGMYDMVTLEDAEDWCKIKDVDGLISELNLVLAQAAQ